MGDVVEITAPVRFRTIISSNKYVIVDFYATWCPPCKMIAPTFEHLAAQHEVPGHLAFVKINIDQHGSLAQPYGVRALPTFMVFKDGKPVQTLPGANPPPLKNAIDKVAREVKEAAAPAAAIPESAPSAIPAVETAKETVKASEVKAEVVNAKALPGSYCVMTENNWKMSLA